MLYYLAQICHSLGHADADLLPLYQMFANAYEDYYRTKDAFEERLYELCPFDFDRISCDDYDCSIEFYEVPNDIRLNDAAQQFIRSHGFSKCWLNHQDGWETLYGWSHARYKASEGWRKRQHKRKLPDGSPDPSGLIEVEDEFPKNWPKEWLKSGYVTVIPTKG
ncbi:MAG TPA: hypothetical protein VMG10_32915 [Gemmataceae bacterium]|nr:hypothetical protein [Gemmataceae bacterium]